jgi:hypothetical protein
LSCGKPIRRIKYNSSVFWIMYSKPIEIILIQTSALLIAAGG